MNEEKTTYGNAPVYLQFLTAQQYADLNQPAPSSVHCFPLKDNQILFTMNPRGIDIIGGHVEVGETPLEALKRECNEEASIVINDYKLIGAIQVDNRENPQAIEKGYPTIGYQLFYVSTNFTELEFKADFECTDRKYVDYKDIPKMHHNWLNTHNEVLQELNNILSKKNKLKI